MLKMVDGTGIIGVDMVCPLGGTVSPPQPPNYDKVEMEGAGSLMLPNSLKAPLERVELTGNSTQGENPAPDNPQEIKSAGKWNEEKQKYEIDVKVTGKNLLNLQKQPDVKGTYWGWKVSNGEKIALSVKDKGNNADITGCYLGLSKTGGSSDGVVWVVKHGVNAKKEIVSTNQYVSVHPPNETVVRKLLERFDIQVEYGTVATTYEPYREQTVQIALDEPLRGIGEYKDVLTKDGVVRKIKRAVFDGSEDEKWGLARELENHINFALVIKDAIAVNTGIRTMMDKFKYFGAIWNSDLLGQDMFGATLRINMPKTLATDLQTFKTWLSQNPLTVDYVLAEPVTEPLPESVQQQLQALHSENGVTHVFVDSGEIPCGIKLTYRKEK